MCNIRHLLLHLDLQSTMGSSRRFGTTSELKLQKMVRQHDTHVDASQIGSPVVVDRTTRFDDDITRDAIDRKQEVCFNLNKYH
jgi:hypothetical protein